ncbi:MAG: 30S ribosomal protein S15 [Elusimicrobia bacterium]|nr:MAG: 30S ribosomal protein S15 [Elusimicrobiota bacterium]
MITKEKKTDIIKKFQTSTKDVGSTPIQVAMLTHRIREISGHLKTHKKDYSSQLGLLKLVSQRRSLLAYIKKHDLDGYSALIKELELRK